jgi:proteasome lid subunit RPN8/RPN11
MSLDDVSIGRTEAARPLRISRDVAAVILDHARGCVPDECCGLLLGCGTVVHKVWPARNELASPTRYRVDPRDYVAAARYGRGHGLEVIGAYHSHPVSRAVPSPTDLAESAGEDFIYLIAGHIARPPHKAELRAYRLVSGNFAELPIVTDTQENLS